MSYTACRIGGVDVFVDPDSIGEDVTPFGEVVPSIDGTFFAKSLLQINPHAAGSVDRVNVNGVYLKTAQVGQLKNLSVSRALVQIVGVPGIAETATYFINGFSHNPLKPAVVFPGEDVDSPPVRHAYSMTLTRVG